MTENNYPTIMLDGTQFGSSPIFMSQLPYDWWGKIKVNDIVWIADDDIKPFLCQVTEVLTDGESACFERLDKPKNPKFYKAINPKTSSVEWLLILDADNVLWSYDPYGEQFWRNRELTEDYQNVPHRDVVTGLTYQQITKDEARRLTSAVPRNSNEWRWLKIMANANRFSFEQAFGK